MATAEEDARFEGFSIYAEVSADIHQAVMKAVEGYSAVESAHSESAGLRPDEAAEHKANILSAAYRLVTELQTEAEKSHSRSDRYESILDDWQGDDDETGQIAQLHETQLSNELPGWLNEFVLQIHEAAWQLGYLRGGRYEQEEGDTPEADVSKIFDSIGVEGVDDAGAGESTEAA